MQQNTQTQIKAEELFDKLSEIPTLKYATVLVDAKQRFLQGEVFSYSIPEWLEDKIQIGSFVQVPFGKQKVRGLVIQIENKTFLEEDEEFEIKEITNVLKEKIFSEDYIAFLAWISDFYQSDLLTTLKGVLPISLLGSIQERVQLKDLLKFPSLTKVEQKIIDVLKESNDGDLSIKFLKQKVKSSRFNAALDSLLDKGVVEKNTKIKKSVKAKKINSAAQKGKYISSDELNQNQKQIFESINKGIRGNQFSEHLIHGVTGSGKTEIYFALAREALARGKQVIYLVPEISLTVQLIERVQANFPNTGITLWHSNLSDGQRVQAWNECLDDQPRIVVGARSAVFAPLNNLGLVIIDEEHDGSYKSGNRPFYDARTIAKQRAELTNSIVVSGSATPSVEKYFNAQKNNQLHELTQRFNQQPMPKVEIVDMRQELNDGNKSIFSRKLQRALNDCIQNNEQAILLLNRRGYANYVFCRDCGYAVFCDNCSVPLIYHSSSNAMHCHHCDLVKPVMNECPNCQSKKIKQTGLGTQRLEQEVIRNFPDAEVIRLDRDISSKRQGVQEVWEQLTTQANPNKAQILVGTQLVAKGIDLPRVTLVAAIHAESGMYMPDYLASERTFQLLTQAAGRAGRHQKEGRVVFQTYIPENKVIQYSAEHDYKAFYESEILNRQEHFYPPYKNLARIVLHNKDNQKAKNEAQEIASLVKALVPISKEKENINRSSLESPLSTCGRGVGGEGVEILGPAPCPIEKINNLFRWQLLLKADDLDSLRQANLLINSNISLQSRMNFDLMPMNLI